MVPLDPTVIGITLALKLIIIIIIIIINKFKSNIPHVI
jgi:hypothetical protein